MLRRQLFRLSLIPDKWFPDSKRKQIIIYNLWNTYHGLWYVQVWSNGEKVAILICRSWLWILFLTVPSFDARIVVVVNSIWYSNAVDWFIHSYTLQNIYRWYLVKSSLSLEHSHSVGFLDDRYYICFCFWIIWSLFSCNN